MQKKQTVNISLLSCLSSCVLVFQETMIRGNTLLTLAVVVGLAYVFGKDADSEKRQEGESLLPDIEPDVADVPEDEKKAGTVNDPRWRFRLRYRRKYRRSRYRRTKPYPTRKPYPTQRPYPTQKPPTTELPCSASRPADFKWANEWQGPMSFECPTGKTELFAL